MNLGDCCAATVWRTTGCGTILVGIIDDCCGIIGETDSLQKNSFHMFFLNVLSRIFTLRNSWRILKFW